MLTIASRPPDVEHPFGHDKAEYFSSLIEGVLIVLAALGIVYTAINRIYHPQPLEALNMGMVLSVLATLINLVTSRILLYYGRKHNSITLEADAHHLMTDVWTTVGIIVGIFLVKLTHWQILDPLMAIAVAMSIVYTGTRLIIRSTDRPLQKDLYHFTCFVPRILPFTRRMKLLKSLKKRLLYNYLTPTFSSI